MRRRVEVARTYEGTLRNMIRYTSTGTSSMLGAYSGLFPPPDLKTLQLHQNWSASDIISYCMYQNMYSNRFERKQNDAAEDSSSGSTLNLLLGNNEEERCHTTTLLFSFSI